MKILYITFEDLGRPSGVEKKIRAQCDGLKSNEIEVSLYSIGYEDGGVYAIVDGERIYSYGKRIIRQFRLRKRYNHIIDYVTINHFDSVYVRFAHDNPFLFLLYRRLKKRGVKILLEIPTYPYDGISANVNLFFYIIYKLEKVTRRFLKYYVDRVVTVQDYDSIIGIPTIKISNGIDINSIPLRQIQGHSGYNFVGVAQLNIWHGYDRLIEGIGLYYKNGGKEDVHFYIIGGYDIVFEKYQKIINNFNIKDHIHLEGQKNGKDLDSYFDIADLAIGSLGAHRKGISEGKALKCVEYASRGIPFLYSDINTDFDKCSFIKKAPQDESPIDVKSLIDFIKSNHFEKDIIRQYVVDNLTWSIQMKKVIEEIPYI